jgi:hypothetical protein
MYLYYIIQDGTKVSNIGCDFLIWQYENMFNIKVDYWLNDYPASSGLSSLFLSSFVSLLWQPTLVF